jgi:hypothetical protein
MKLSRTWSCLLLLGAVLSLSGCDQILKIFGIGGGGVHTTTTVPVSINRCAVTAGNDPIIEHPGTPVTWNFSDQTYVITIDTKIDQNINPPTTIAPSVTNTSSGAKWDNANTPTDCSTDTTTNKKKGCYFKYNISAGGKVCNDPGIQIIPN